jgi:hypothetical protein
LIVDCVTITRFHQLSPTLSTTWNTFL